MKNKELIRSVLHERLTDNSLKHGTVSVLSGPWGCGKTYLWLNDILPLLSGKSAITLSLFGLESIAALKTQLMNQCLILKACSLGEGKLKRALSGSKNLLLEGFKKALKGVDSVIGTNLLSWNIDPLQLVDENLIVCFDDIERISSKIGLDEVFGLTNYLAEHKHCKVLLIMNEEALLKNDNPNAKTMLKYKERLVDYHLQVNTDLESAFDLFSNQYSKQTELYDYLINNKLLVLQSMLTSKCENLRTLKKIIEGIAEILHQEEIELEPKLIPSMVALQIESSEGKLHDPDFYNFNEMSLMIASKFNEQETGQGGISEKRKIFHKSYFGNSEGYYFIRAFYDQIKYGYFDWSELKKEINPESPPQDGFTLALAAPQSREWWYLSDEEYATWINQIEGYIFSNQLISTAKLITAAVYLKHAVDMSGMKLNPETDKRIRERLSNNALSGDESFNHESRMFLSQQKNVWAPYLDGYDEIAKAAAIKSIISDIIKVITTEDITTFSEFINQKPKGLIAALSEKGMSALRKTYEKNPMFFNDAIIFINKELLANRTTQIIPKVEEKLSQVRNFVAEVLKNGIIDNSGNLRLERLLEKLPIVGEDKRDN